MFEDGINTMVLNRKAKVYKRSRDELRLKLDLSIPERSAYLEIVHG